MNESPGSVAYNWPRIHRGLTRRSSGPPPSAKKDDAKADDAKKDDVKKDDAKAPVKQ